MTAQNEFTQFYTDCKALEQNGSFLIVGSFRVRADIVPSAEELDRIVELADQIGDFIKRNIATTTLEQADRRAARLAQEIAPHLQKHGRRSFTIIAPYGRLKPNRQRLFDPKTGKTVIPSAKLWNTAQNRHIAASLAKSSCETSQVMSFRKSQKKISATARVDSLLAHSTIWNLKQDEGKHLESAQRKLVDEVLSEHGEMLDTHGFLPPHSKKNASKTDVPGDVFEEVFPEDVEEQAKSMYCHFTAGRLKIKSENDIDNEKIDENTLKRQPRRIPADTILLQADEVVTKSQEPGRKANKTFTATLEDGSGRCEYVATKSSESLQKLVAVILVLWGLFSGKNLEVISDGAAWIGLWIGRLCGVEVYHLLCWYHLCKRVCTALSGLGFPKGEREKWQREILGRLWKGDVTGAIEILKSLLPRCRVRSRVEELIDYLQRKRSWIGDYEGRHEAGLWIASTRVEKWNDTAVSERCKHRGMSWTESGVLAMALHASEQKRDAAQNAQFEPELHTSL